MAELPRLRVGLTLDSQTFIRETNRVIDSVNSMSRRITTQNASMQRSFNQVTGALNTLRAGFAALGVGAALRSLAQAQIAFDKINNTLRAGTGSAQAAARGYQFVRSEAQRLGLDLETAAGQFAKLAAASRGTVLEGERTRDIFSAVAEAATVLGLSAEQTGGALTAIEQIISKGTVSAEELRGQLGERLPGAFQIAARAIGVTTEQLGEMLKAGELTAEELLPALATELRKTFGPEVAQAAQGLQATLNRLNTSWFEFRTAVAQGGVAQALSDIAKGLTDAASGSDAFASQLGADLGDIIRGFGEGLRVAATHLRELSALVVTFISYKAAELFLNLANAVRTTTAAMLGFNVAMRANPIGLAATAIGVVVGLLYEFRDATIQVGDRTTTIGGLVIEIWERIRAGIEVVLPGLRKVGELVGAVLDAVGISVAQASEPFDVMAQKLAVVQSQLTQMREMSAAIVASGVTPDVEITNEIARLEAAQKDLVTQLDAAQLAETRFKEAVDQTNGSVNNQGDGIGTLTDEMKRLAESMARMVDDANRENQQLTQLNLAYRGLGSSVEDVTVAMKIDDQLRAAKITRQQAEESGLLKILVANERLVISNEKLSRVDEQIAKAQEALAAAREKNAAEVTRQAEQARAEQAAQAEQTRRLIEQPFVNALENVQRTFADTFETIFSGGVKTFGDLASEIKDIFIRLAAEIAALMVIQPILRGVAGTTGIVGQTLLAPSAAGAITGSTAGIIPASYPSTATAGLTPAAVSAGFGGGFGGGLNRFGAGLGFAAPTAIGAPLVRGGIIPVTPGTAGAFPLTLAQTLGYGAAGGLGGALIGSMFGGRGMIGGGLGGGFGALGGGALGAAGLLGGSIAGPGGALIGGLAGSLLGGFVGSLFGGGGGQTNRVNIQGALGAARGGTGAAAKFVQGIDKELQNLLTTAQEATANRALALATGIRVEYSKQPSENDLARLARGRIAPVATALGFRRSAISGGGRTAEEQIQRLTEALNVQAQVKDLTSGMGEFTKEARDLNQTFLDLAASAEEFGISTEGLPEAQRKAGFDLVRNELDQLAVGGPTVAKQIQNLKDRFQDLRNGASLFGYSLNEIKEAQKAATRALTDQLISKLQQMSGLAPTFAQQLKALNEEFFNARQEADVLGYSIRAVRDAQVDATRALKEQQLAQRDTLALAVTDPFKALSDPLQEFLADIRVADLNPLKQFENARREFERVANLARAGSTIAMQQLQSVGQQYIELAAAVGASPRAAQARLEVAGVIESVLAELDQAQREASRGIEGEIRAASQREVDTIREMIDVGRDIVSEIKRLGRA